MDRVPTRKQDISTGHEFQKLGPVPVVGARVLDQYEIFEVNEGGFGYVLGLIDVRTEERIAAKIPKQHDGRASSLEEFTKEVTIWVDLAPHNNIVTARSVREIHGVPALFMDFVDGPVFRTLRELLRMARPSLETTIDYGYQICLGMEAANNNREVVHMDLKPENLMIEKGKTVKITDFGLAHRVRVTNGAYEKRYAGSWPYAAPERFADQPCDSRSDIYSLGVILYEMLTGTFPYPFELSDDPAEAYRQLRDFHASDGMDRVSNDLYNGGIPGVERQVTDVVSTFVNPSRGERSRSFGQALSLMQQLGAKPASGQALGLTVLERLARAEGLQAVGEHSAALSILNRLLIEEPGNGALYLAAAKSLDATGDSKTAQSFRERTLAILRFRP
jgi:serine/threonine protein kinase